VRRGSIFQLVLIGLIAGAIAAAAAVLVPWLPYPATKEAHRIFFVYWFTTVICLVIFAVVCAIMIYAIINFRAKPGDWSDGPPVHGNTTIEIIWTVIPAILVTAVSIVSAIVLAQNGHAGSNPLVVQVEGQQFAWQFVYPNGKAYPVLRIPNDRGVKLEITSKDVIHSFWVPQFAQKQDAVPGQINTLVITPDVKGDLPRRFPVICTELCGLGHSLMRSWAIVMTKAAYATWYAGSPQTAPSPTGGAGASGGAAIFTSSGCAACHTFSAIPDAVGKVGPSLDNLSESAKAAGQPLEDFIRQSIVDPNAYIAPGYQPGVMPGTYNHTIVPHSNIDVLVHYLATNTK
jgi:cytochrome c oxidase subunit 2